MKHDPSVVGETSLFLVATLTDMVRCVSSFLACLLAWRYATVATADSQPLVAAVTASSVMVLPEYLRYVLTSYRANRATFLRHGCRLILILGLLTLL